jgi:hypothetical protein
VSRTSLDIICEVALGHTIDSLHNPHHELAEAYETLSSLQCGTTSTCFCRGLCFFTDGLTGSNLALLIGLMMIPGLPRLLSSDWLHRNKHFITKIPGLGEIF